MLEEEQLLTPGADEEAIFVEFAAVFLELSCFAPSLVASFFPCLEKPEALRALLESDVPAVQLMKQTRLPGAPDPLSREEHQFAEATEYFRELTAESEEARRAGNLVRAAVERQRAARVAPSDKAEPTRRAAIDILEELLSQFQQALALPLEEAEGWRRLLPVLLDKADQGSNAAEAVLLFDLQKVCLDHESEIYASTSANGSRRWEESAASAVALSATGIAYAPRRDASFERRPAFRQRPARPRQSLQAPSSQRTAGGQRFVPSYQALHDVGFEPQPLEQTAFRKIVEEFLDRIIASGFVTFSDLRDTISQPTQAARSRRADRLHSRRLLHCSTDAWPLLDGTIGRRYLYARSARFTSTSGRGSADGFPLSLPCSGGRNGRAALLLIVLAKLHVVASVDDARKASIPYVSAGVSWFVAMTADFVLLHSRTFATVS